MASSTDNSSLAKVKEIFAEKFGGESRVFRAPGRVNLIGEHTDYNDGFVLPAAIDLYTWVAIAPRNDVKLHVFSANLNQSVEIKLSKENPRPKKHWSDYVQGVAIMLQNSGLTLRAANIAIHSDVPSGSGLSSSAALEVSIATALLAVSNHSLDKVQVAKHCQRAENEFVGARCGIMDQFTATFGRAGHAILLDCRSLEGTPLRLSAGISLVICNTMVKHEHSAGEYNARRAQCEDGVRLLKKWHPHISALRDISMEDIEAHESKIPPVIFRRCRHVIRENARVLDTVKALKENSLSTIGKLMAQSHQSLRDDFEASCSELDIMVELAQKERGVIGSRMTGGGFGGCTINLVETERVEQFRESIGAAYRSATGMTSEIYVSQAGEGASEVL